MDYLNPTSINGLNLYAYCNNDPVNYCDPLGHITITTAIILGLIGIGALAGFGAVAYGDYSDDGEIFNGSIGWEAYVRGSIGGAIAISSIGELTLVGAGVLTGAVSFGATVMFAKGVGPRMGHNQYENKQFKQLCNKHHLTKEEARILHDYISHQNLSYHEIEEIIFELFGK